ncbi:MAG: amino acid ABC transporter ATP-binding protein [Oscillospiraceae bacterium]
MPILTIRHVSKYYSGGLAALQDVSLTVEKGEAVAIIGSSGSGKSTLLRCVNNLERVSAGNIVIDGETLVFTDERGAIKYPPDKEIRRICTKTGMVFQHFNLFPHLTCLENITIAPIKILQRGREESLQKARQLLDTVGLSAKANSYPDQLSGGQKQRVAIARALAIDPQIMLFDEPTSALDPEITNEVTNVILNLVRQKVTMVIVTHDMRFARSAASRVVFMDEGRIVEEGPPAKLFDEPESPRLQSFLKSYFLEGGPAG